MLGFGFLRIRIKDNEMKSYTDIEQSRKLTEILPPESADMYYYSYMSIGEPFYMSYPNVIEDRQRLAKNDIPCWSLTAMLEVLPILDNRSPVIPKTFDGKYRAIYHSTAYEKAICTSDYDNPVDACYEMIIKLHDSNLL